MGKDKKFRFLYMAHVVEEHPVADKKIYKTTTHSNPSKAYSAAIRGLYAKREFKGRVDLRGWEVDSPLKIKLEQIDVSSMNSKGVYVKRDFVEFSVNAKDREVIVHLD